MESPGEGVSDLRQLIRAHVISEPIQEKLKECVSEIEGGGGEQKEELLMQLLEDKGLVDEVMAALQLKKGRRYRSSPPIKTEGESSATKHTRNGKPGQYIYLQIKEGKAFIDHLTSQSEPLPPVTPTFKLHIHFRGQRFHSAPVPCACEPEFNEGFLLELWNSAEGKTSPDMLTLADPIQLVLTETSPQGDTELVGTAEIDWRPILGSSSGRISKSIELTGLKMDGRVPPGVLDLQWELFPRGKGCRIDKDIVEAQLKLEHQKTMEKKRLFLLYAKQWWQEYISMRQNHSQRLVKIFAENEKGESQVVCDFVEPLRVGRLLDGPRHAARFVSLIKYRNVVSVGEKSVGEDAWRSRHSILVTGSGSCEDHAILLCSLLLGYGLNAYICMGTKVKGLAHTWVMTCNMDGSVVFWESLTGQRFFHPAYDPDIQAGTAVTPPTHPYRTIGCVFNHCSFYANIQPSDNILTCQFDLHHRALWKSLSRDALQTIIERKHGPDQSIPPILSSQLNGDLISSELEQELQALITQHRMVSRPHPQDCGLPTQWDTNLSYLLGPALSSYELERREGKSMGVEEFQEAIRRYVPEGHTFKGFPIQFAHTCGRKIFVTCLNSTVGGDIISCRGDNVRMAVRVRVYVYPENLCAVWCMIALTYNSVL